MKNTIRLLVTEKCNRACLGYCNKDYDLKNLPVFNHDYYKKHKKDIKQIIITGGEPLLFQNRLSNLMINMLEYKDVKFILYTAFVKKYHKNIRILAFFDGITLTFHEQSDVKDSIKFLSSIPKYMLKNKTFRLNVFEGIDISEVKDLLIEWDVRTGYKWIKDAPVPENEIFMRLEKLIGE